MELLESQLSGKFSAMSQLSVKISTSFLGLLKFYSIFQLSINFEVFRSQLSVKKKPASFLS